MPRVVKTPIARISVPMGTFWYLVVPSNIKRFTEVNTGVKYVSRLSFTEISLFSSKVAS